MQNPTQSARRLKMVVLDGYTLNPGDISWDPLRTFGELTLFDRTAPHEVTQRAAGFEVVFTNKTPITGETIRSLTGLRYIGVLATGYNVVDVRATGEAGIVVTNIPAYGTMAVAQMVFAHLLEICHHVAAHHQAVVSGQWTRSGDYCFWNHPLIELDGKTLGIIGMGRIGRAVARIARSFGMRVLAHDPMNQSEPETDRLSYVSLDDLLAGADVITLHCPLTPDTLGLINNLSIDRMKDGVILINTSRGALIVEDDLDAALRSGKIAAAGLDVLSAEPPPADHPLFSTPNCLITPHIAWAPTASRLRLMQLAAENLRAFLDGNPVNVVNS